VPKSRPPQIVPEFDTLTPEKEVAIAAFYNNEYLPRHARGSTTAPSNTADGKATGPPIVVPWPVSLARLNEADQRLMCYKLMVARKFDPKAAAAMLDLICRHRHMEQTDTRVFVPPAMTVRGFGLDSLKAFIKQDPSLQPENDEIHRIYRHAKCEYWPAFHKTSRWGHPVLLESMGAIRPASALKKLKQLAKPGEPLNSVLFRYHCYVNELSLRLVSFADAAIAAPEGRRIHGIVVLVDAAGLSTAHLDGRLIDCVKAMWGLDQQCYPELVHAVLVANCPALIRFAFGLVKGALDERVQQKIHFFAPGSATREGLLRFIAPEDLPHHLGGQCRCPGGCTEPGVSDDGSAAAAAVAGGDLAEVGIPIAAGKRYERSIMLKPNQQVVCDWESDNADTIEFSATFVTGPSQAILLAAKTRAKHGTLQYAVPADAPGGEVRLLFDNAFSWMTSKSLTLRVLVSDALE
jgi:hypothetical protein